MRISDWSSDVCSSDLLNAAALGSGGGKVDFSIGESEIGAGWHLALFHPINQVLQALLNDPLKGDKPVRRRAVRLRGHQDRKSVVSGTSVSVRVELGGRRILKKKMTITQ